MSALELGGGFAAGLAAGILSGVFGIGGGIVLVPFLALLLGLTQHDAQGVTLLVLTLPIGLPAVLAYRRHTPIRWRLVSALVVGFLVGVAGGARGANWIPDSPLRLLFILFLVLVGLQGWFARAEVPTGEGAGAPVHSWHGLWIGAAAGALSGLLGIGGGIVMVPLLIHVVGLERLDAQGASLAAMLPPIGLPGVLVYASAQGGLPWGLASAVVSGFVAGASAGASLATKMSGRHLGRAFSLFVLCIAAALGWGMLSS